MTKKITITIKNTLILVIILLFFGCDKSPEITQISTRTIAQKVGTVFTSIPNNSFSAPKLIEIPFPHADNVDAIWGATGLDDQGNIYFGASTHGGKYRSAYLYQLNPKSGKITQQGDVLSQLKRAGFDIDGVGQNKLHSKIYQANDGYLYFSSFDECGESEGVNPTWGGHLWRKKPQAKNWEHIFATKEALVAVNTNGQFVYTLGYWDHVLYQYDTQTNKTKRVVVGSVGEHTSRNFIVDEQGHAYVPMLIENDFNEIETYLNEYDTRLNLIESYPIPQYLQEGNNKKEIESHHGIVAYTSLKDGRILFTSSTGSLFEVNPFAKKIDKLKYKGNMHPDGKAYIASLFTFEGKSIIIGISREKNKNKYQWIMYELQSDLSMNYPIDTGEYKGLLLYGSSVKGDQGNFYVGGWTNKEGLSGHRPVLFKVSYK